MGLESSVLDMPMPSAGEAPPRLIRTSRRGPVLRPSPALAGVYGLDLTAGCIHGCPYCYIRGSSRFPGDGRVLFDPFVVERLVEALDGMEMAPSRVVLSPSSDPLPPSREVRASAVEAVRVLISREIPVVLMTRGRIPGKLVDILANESGGRKSIVCLGITTLDRSLSRRLEPRAGSLREGSATWPDWSRRGLRSKLDWNP